MALAGGVLVLGNFRCLLGRLALLALVCGC